MRTFLKWLLASLLVLCILFVALFPTLASSEWGHKQLLSWINQSIPGRIEIRSLNLNWTKGQAAEGILLKDPQGQSVVGIEKLTTEATLWQLLRKSIHLGRTEIEELNAAIVTDDKGLTNLQRALGIPPSHESPPLSPSTILLSKVNANGYLFAENHPLSLSLSGLTKQDNLNGSFEVNITIPNFKLADWDELKQHAQHYLTIEGSKEAKIQSHITNFPVDLIDRMIVLYNPRLNGLFRSLLGDRLNVKLEKEPSQEGLAFKLNAQSPLMSGDFKGKVSEGVLKLNETALLQFKLEPEPINAIIGNHVELLNPTQLKVSFPSLSFPLNFLDEKADVHPCAFAFTSNIHSAEIQLEIPEIGKVNLTDFNGSLEAPPCIEQMHLSLTTLANKQQGSFSITVDATSNKPKNLSQLLNLVKQNVEGSLKLSHFPIKQIPFFKQNPEWLEQIGSQADAQVAFHPKGDQEWDMDVTLQTARLSLKEAKMHLGKELFLLAPARLEWLPTENFLKNLTSSELLKMQNPSSVHFLLKDFHLPLKDPQMVRFESQIEIPLLTLSPLSPYGTPQLKEVHLKVSGDTLSDIKSQLKGQFSLLTKEDEVSPLLQEPLAFTLHSKIRKGAEGKIEIPSAKLEIKNAITILQAEGKLKDQHLLELTQPLQIRYSLTPLAYSTLNAQLAKDLPKLQEKASLSFTIDPTTIDLHHISIDSLRLKGKLLIDQLVFQDAAGASTKLQDISFPWVMDVPADTISGELKGLILTKMREKPSQLSAFIQLWLTKGHYDAAHTKVEMKANVDGMPTALFNMFFPSPELSPLMGPIIDLNLKTFIDPTKEKPGYWDLSMDSSLFHVNSRLKVTDAATILDPNKIPSFRLTVTPEGFEYLKHQYALPEELKLAAPTTFSGYLSEFHLPLNRSWMEKGQFEFHFSTDEIKWKNSPSSPIQLEGKISTKNIFDQIQWMIQAQGAAENPLVLQGTVKKMFDSQGKLNGWQEMDLQTQLEGKKLTPSFLQTLFLLNSEASKKLTAFFGPSIDLGGRFELQHAAGPVEGYVKGEQGALQLDGKINRGLLTLNKPLEGSVKLTPLFSQTFLEPNVPFLKTAVDSERAIRLTIDPSQFSCPLQPFQLDQVKVGKGILDLGKIRFRNEGDLSSVLNFVHSIAEPYFTIWFTPLYFDLKQGILDLKRLDLLVANSYTLASWGQINLINKQVELVLGLSAQSLQYAFGVQGLDKNYLLQVPLSSKNGKIEIDRKKATGRITALVAQSQGGSHGKLLGNLLDAALSNKDEIAPPPTTQPFPWENELNSAPSKPEQPISKEERKDKKDKEHKKDKKKQKHKNREKDSLKGFQEGAIQVLDQFLSK